MIEQIISWWQSLSHRSFAYRDIIGQDKWNDFTPSFTSLSSTGTPTITGRYRIIGKSCQVQVLVTPATNTSSTSGTTYFNLPVTASGLSGMGLATRRASNNIISGCHTSISNSRCYTPTWTNETGAIQIWNEYEV